jgi:hypothetical protein
VGLKADEDFLRYLTMGAVGCAAVARDLGGRHHHDVAELERYTMSNKLWQTKVKRLRLPDLMCLACGLRVEARAKSKLEIKLSDSETAVARQWDAGLRGEDLVAFMKCFRDGDLVVPADRPEYFTVRDLRDSVTSSKLGPRKSASEGSERDRKWPARVPTGPGTVLLVRDGVVVARLDSERQRTFRPVAGTSFVYVREGQHFDAESQFILGAVAGAPALACPGDGWDVIGDLEADDPVSRYAAVKAAGLRRLAGAHTALEAIANDADVDERIRLEAGGSLARLDPDIWLRWLRDFGAEADDRALAMEAIFILTELGTETAARILLEIAGARAHFRSEERAAAVWGLGSTGADRPDLLVGFIADEDDTVALHALTGMGTLAHAQLDELGGRLGADPRTAAAAATALARQREAGAPILARAAESAERERDWALYALGTMDRRVVDAAVGVHLSPATRRALEPMWLGGAGNWLAGRTAQELDLLDRQRFRPDPGDP